MSGFSVQNQPQAELDFAPSATDSQVKIQVAPLIDTVLFLIWFYLLVGQLVMHQKDASIQLAAMASPTATTEQPAEITLNLRQDGSVLWEGRALSLDQLQAALAGQLAKAGGAAARSGEAAPGGAGLRVVVRADRRGQFAQLDDVLRTCQRAGLKEVVFRAREAGSP